MKHKPIDPAATEDRLSTFSDFQKTEYEHIAEAHFKAIEAISSFVRYYLLLMSLPVSILAVLFGFAGRSSDFQSAAVNLLGLTSPFLFVVGLAGFCMMIYIVNIKMDVVLYSRVVNSIRKFFYDYHDADHATKLLMRQLPQSAYLPKYLDWPFTFVILTFAMFDALYLAAGIHLFIATQIKSASTLRDLNFNSYSKLGLLEYSGIVSAAFACHFVAYYLCARSREFSYLRASAIGIDVDGVLNKHREQFCEFADSKLNKQIKPDEIKILPVHENTSLSVPITRDDERRIFNDPDYWLGMPALEGAADVIRTIRRSYLIPVHIFTYRPWPDVSSGESLSWTDIQKVRSSWISAAGEMLRLAGAKECMKQLVYVLTRLNYRSSIKYITKYWLVKHGIGFDSLLVERGNENIVYSRGRYENRFAYAKRKKIRFFVEDDWVKAVKLSYICDVVFLIDHPYNRTSTEDPSKHADETIMGRLPANVIRVQSWDELKKNIAQLV